ncbi:MAG: T9SS type B sorting domain-containing protein [Endomicrobiales bacterium]
MQRTAYLIILLWAGLLAALWAAGTPAGTVVSNGGDRGAAGADDSPGDTLLSFDYLETLISGFPSNEVSVTVSPGYAAGAQAAFLNASALPGGATWYPFTITNYSNISDTIAFSVTVSSGMDWPVTLLKDDNNDGIHQEGETALAADSGLLAPDASYRLFLSVVVPSTAAAGEFCAAQVSFKNQSGAGTEDHWPQDGNDTVVLTAATTLDGTPPEIAYHADNPKGEIGVLGNRVLVRARAQDPESGILSVELHYRVDADTFTAAMTLSDGLYSLDLGSAVTQPCTLRYFVRAANGAGLVTSAEEQSVVLSRLTSAGQVNEGRVEVQDGNPLDGNTALVIPPGALASPIPLTIEQKNPSEYRTTGGLAISDHPSAIFELGPSGTVFVKPVTLTLLYPDLDNDGREDVSGFNENLLRLFWWDGFEWRFLGGQVDTVQNTVTVQVMHFSLYAAFGAAEPLPEDYRPKERIITPNGDGKNDFAAFGLSGGYVIRIFDTAGRPVRTLENENIWDGRDDQGGVVESGAYMYQFRTGGKLLSGVIAVAK